MNQALFSGKKILLVSGVVKTKVASEKKVLRAVCVRALAKGNNSKRQGPSQPFLIMLNWLIAVLKGLDPSTWCQLYLAYDNMCHVDGMRIAKKPLPLPQPYSHMWLKINKIIDSLHISNHKDSNCKLKYDPLSLKEELPDVNTMAAEQTFVWLSRFKKILCAMPKVHHLFFLHRIIVHRNLYTVSCYKRGLKPVLPVVRKKT